MVDGGAKAVRQPKILVDEISKLCQDPVTHPNRHLHIGYLDSGQNDVFMHPQSGLLCGAALPGAFSPRKNRSLVLLQPKTVFLAFY